MLKLMRYLLLALLWPVFAGAAAAPTEVKTIWRLLDYLAVDYRGAVANGAVISASEYAEMSDFSATVLREISALPAGPEHDELVSGAQGLQSAIAGRESPETVARKARDLAGQLLAVYPIALSPRVIPDLARGHQLYAEGCSACHGNEGKGNGPASASLDPKPVDFTDLMRARERSVFALYQVIGQGLDGTSMRSFANLPDEDRWALAFVVGQFAFPEASQAQGKQLWRDDAQLREAITGMDALTTTTPATLSTEMGDATAVAAVSYLRRNPAAVTVSQGSVLKLARDRLRESADAYRKGDRATASRLAVSAYLDGFEPVEPQLAAKDEPLLRRVETAMTDLRSSISSGVPEADFMQRIDTAGQLLDQAEARLGAHENSPASAFVGAFTILLREGLEALLIVVAIVAFLRKANRSEVLPYVHAGTVVALLGGVATWGAATYLISISGASREATEGGGSLFAAAVLLFVGIWMHGKSQAGAWQQYIKEKVDQALTRRSAWFLFALAFVVVYREVFETILFYVALWSEGNHHAVLGGAATAILGLALIACLLLAYSTRLPIGKFFSLSAGLMAILAVVLTGKGVAALQEANLMPERLLALPRVDLVGFFPTLQGVMAQSACVIILVIGFAYNRRAAGGA